jgi:hypothetical protein
LCFCALHFDNANHKHKKKKKKEKKKEKKKKKKEKHQESERLLGILRSSFPEDNPGEEGRTPSSRWLFM